MSASGKHSYTAVLSAIKSTLTRDESMCGFKCEIWCNLIWDIVVCNGYVLIDTCFDSYKIDDPVTYLFGSRENYDYWRRSILGRKLNGWHYEVYIEQSSAVTDIIIKVITAISIDIDKMHKFICSEMSSDQIVTTQDACTIQYHSPRSKRSMQLYN